MPEKTKKRSRAQLHRTGSKGGQATAVSHTNGRTTAMVAGTAGAVLGAALGAGAALALSNKQTRKKLVGKAGGLSKAAVDTLSKNKKKLTDTAADVVKSTEDKQEDKS